MVWLESLVLSLSLDCMHLAEISRQTIRDLRQDQRQTGIRGIAFKRPNPV